MISEKALKNKYLFQTAVDKRLFMEYIYERQAPYPNFLTVEKEELDQKFERMKNSVSGEASATAELLAEQKLKETVEKVQEIWKQAVNDPDNAELKKKDDELFDKSLKSVGLSTIDLGFLIKKKLVTDFDVNYIKFKEEYYKKIHDTIKLLDIDVEEDVRELAALYPYTFNYHPNRHSEVDKNKEYQRIKAVFNEQESRYNALKTLIRDKYYRKFKAEAETKREAEIKEAENREYDGFFAKEKRTLDNAESVLRKQWENTLPLIQKLCEDPSPIDQIITHTYQELLKRDEGMEKGKEIAMIRYSFYISVQENAVIYYYESGYMNPRSSFVFEKNNFRPLNGTSQTVAVTIVLADQLYKKMKEDPRYELATISMYGEGSRIHFEISYPNPNHKEAISIF